MKRVSVFGFGNADRQDDGVAWHILVGLAQKMNLITPSEPGDLFTSSKDQILLQFNLQLTPELAETIKDFDVIYFVDAHTGAINERTFLLLLSSPKLRVHLLPTIYRLRCYYQSRRPFMAQFQKRFY
jgi:Ni,Fe-hydrogenase maturation factor